MSSTKSDSHPPADAVEPRAVPARSSRVPGFYRLSLPARHRILIEQAGLTDEEIALLDRGSLSAESANYIAENVVGTYALPLGLGLNFQVNDRDYLIPMCVEEPSVVAAASNAARMVREGGGFRAVADPPLMIAQVQLQSVPDTQAATQAILAAKERIVADCNTALPNLVKRGGGAREVEVRTLLPSTPQQPGMLVVHLIADVRDAMGANLVNTMAEAVAQSLASLARGQVGLRILSNLADRRLVRVTCQVPSAALSTSSIGGEVLRDAIVEASRFAELDPYRAATHNKGIMNGIDPVVIATGNDWRGIEAGAHAYAAISGTYRPLATWRAGADGALLGQMELPMAVAIVGGTLRVHPGARLSLKLLNVQSSGELGSVIAAVGLASNLAALRALAGEGIQRGHMSLHARSVAAAAGATGSLVDIVAEELTRTADICHERAVEILRRHAH